jgi:hypothetical protein
MKLSMGHTWRAHSNITLIINILLILIIIYLYYITPGGLMAAGKLPMRTLFGRNFSKKG